MKKTFGHISPNQKNKNSKENLLQAVDDFEKSKNLYTFFDRAIRNCFFPFLIMYIAAAVTTFKIIFDVLAFENEQILVMSFATLTLIQLVIRRCYNLISIVFYLALMWYIPLGFWTLFCLFLTSMHFITIFAVHENYEQKRRNLLNS